MPGPHQHEHAKQQTEQPAGETQSCGMAPQRKHPGMQSQHQHRHAKQNPHFNVRTPHRIRHRWGDSGQVVQSSSPARLKSGKAAENQGAVGAPKTEVVFQRVFHLHVPSGIGAVVQVAFRILVQDIDGRRTLLLIKREHSDHTL